MKQNQNSTLPASPLSIEFMDDGLVCVAVLVTTVPSGEDFPKLEIASVAHDLIQREDRRAAFELFCLSLAADIHAKTFGGQVTEYVNGDKPAGIILN